jgi:poly-gamma-glutamate capsule biosynthesis protein CapA/YwtB (metallophosphatase superfamily)
MEIYNDRFIIYSLGNFCTYARFNISGPNGIAPMVKLWVNNDGKFIKGKVFPVYQSGEGGARIDPHNRAIYKLKDLTKTDFPEANHFEISDHGEINIKNVNLVDSEEDSYE